MNYNNSNRNNSHSSALSVSKTELSFSSYGGTESLTVTSGASWSISVNPASWGHLTRSGNTLTLKVYANSSTTSRTDYFKLKSGNQEVKVNIKQAASQYNSSPYLNVSKAALFLHQMVVKNQSQSVLTILGRFPQIQIHGDILNKKETL